MPKWVCDKCKTEVRGTLPPGHLPEVQGPEGLIQEEVA